jgi:hypothetical protein
VEQQQVFIQFSTVSNLVTIITKFMRCSMDGVFQEKKPFKNPEQETVEFHLDGHYVPMDY